MNSVKTQLLAHFFEHAPLSIFSPKRCAVIVAEVSVLYEAS